MQPDHFDIVDDSFGVRSVRDVFDYEEGWGLPSSDICEAVGSMHGIV